MSMKKLYLFLALIIMAGSISAQRMVQGVLRSDLPAEKQKAALMSARSNRTFSFDSIDFWVGDGENRAAIVLTWHDTNKTVPDNMVWGYRWSADVDTISGLSLFEAVMKADPRLIGLVQYTGWMGSTINGIGYSEFRSDVEVTFDYEGASAKFKYPYDKETTEEMAATAISEGEDDGVIYHPFDANISGGPYYDYDYWTASTASNVHWFAGWYSGYWSYFVRDSYTQDFSYSGYGASSRKVQNGTWDAWSWNSFMGTTSGTEPGDNLVAATPIIWLNKKAISLSGNVTEQLTASVQSTYASLTGAVWSSKNTAVATVDQTGKVTAVAPGTTEIKLITANGKYNTYCKVTVTGTATKSAAATANISYSDNTLRVKDLAGYTGYITNTAGSVVSTYVITSSDDVKTVNLNKGVYGFTAVKGTEKVSVKFVVK